MGEHTIKLPDVGEVAEAELVEWHVQVGDPVREDDVMAAVMTDKATVEIPRLSMVRSSGSAPRSATWSPSARRSCASRLRAMPRTRPPRRIRSQIRRPDG